MREVEYDAEFMRNFSPTLVHRIMMVPPSSFPSLTMNGQTRLPSLTFMRTLTKEGFLHEADQHTAVEFGGLQLQDKIAQTVRKAFHDAILSQISSRNKQDNANDNDNDTDHSNQSAEAAAEDSASEQICIYGPLLEIIQEMHQKLKSLVPSRTDLHQLLNYGQELQSHLQTFPGVLNVLLDIAGKLLVLESEDRSGTTQQWLDLARAEAAASALDGDQADGTLTLTIPFKGEDEGHYQQDSISNQEVNLLRKEFVVASTVFLHDKIEQTQTDIADFQLGHILAPKIHALGKEYLKRDFETRFNVTEDELLSDLSFHHETDTDLKIVPHSKTWLKEIVEACNIHAEEHLRSGEKRRDFLLQTGWVDNILFRSPRSSSSLEGGDTIGEQNASPFYMPEIFYLDIMSVKAIRMSTKISVVGSALALHASTIAGTGEAASMLRQDPLDPLVQECRQKLIRAMGNKTVGSQELFERGVGDAMMELAMVLNPNLDIDSAKEDSLRTRTVATMRGDDPVIQLLDNRMKNIFREMMVMDTTSRQQVPDSIRSGRAMPTSKGKSIHGTYGDNYLKASKEEFVKKGFSFYADELAESTLMAHRIVNLALYVQGSWVDKMMKDLCTTRTSSASTE